MGWKSKSKIGFSGKKSGDFAKMGRKRFGFGPALLHPLGERDGKGEKKPFPACLIRGEMVNWKEAKKKGGCYAMLEELKQAVYEANLELPRRNLVTYTWGNVSGIDRAKGLFVIKPSGVEYDALQPDDLVVMDLDGKQVEGSMHPSSDTKTHLVLYRAFPEVGGIVHTHSPYAVAWAQAGRDIPAYGTTHADYFYGSIPCARNLTPEEIEADYEANTGNVIVEEFETRKIHPMHVPAVICRNHGPFTWGKDAAQAVYHAVVLEEVAKMALLTERVNPEAGPAPQSIQDKHFLRKHGPNAYYGQASQ